MLLRSFDISTSVIGYSDFVNGKFVSKGHLDLKKIKGLPEKLDFALKYFNTFSVPDCIIAEAALQKVAGGKTNAKTMNTLIAFNFGLTYCLSRAWKCDLKFLEVRSVRKKCGIKIPNGLKQKDRKKIIINFCEDKLGLKFDLTKNGTYKDFAGDEADAIVLALASI